MGMLVFDFEGQPCLTKADDAHSLRFPLVVSLVSMSGPWATTNLIGKDRNPPFWHAMETPSEAARPFGTLELGVVPSAL